MASDSGADLLAIAKKVVNTYRGKHVIRPDEVDDLISDAALGAVKGWRTYDPSHGTLRDVWVWTRAHGEMLDGLRRRMPVGRGPWAQGVRHVEELPAWQRPAQSIEALEPWMHPAAPDDPYDDVTTQIDLARLLAVLPEREREVVERRYLRDEKCQDIAATLGLTADGGRVSQLLRIACTRMREAA